MSLIGRVPGTDEQLLVMVLCFGSGELSYFEVFSEWGKCFFLSRGSIILQRFGNYCIVNLLGSVGKGHLPENRYLYIPIHQE